MILTLSEMGVIAKFGAEGRDLALFSKAFIFGYAESLLCSCVDRALLFAVGHGLQQLRHTGSETAAHQPSCPQCLGSSWTRGRACVPCIGRWIIIHCAIREFQPDTILRKQVFRLLC